MNNNPEASGLVRGVTAKDGNKGDVVAKGEFNETQGSRFIDFNETQMSSTNMFNASMTGFGIKGGL